MIPLFLFGFIFIFQLSTVHSDCPLIQICDCNDDSSSIICDGNNGNLSDSNYFPGLASLPSVDTYSFRNFKRIQSHAFENVTFLSNRSLTIQFINITIIDPDVFSTSMKIPDDSTLSLHIGYSTNPSSLTLKSNAFNHIKINQLRFLNINNFNGRPIFDTNCFGDNLYINELIFEQSSITGFSNGNEKIADVKHLYIRECPTLTQLNKYKLPTFLSRTKTLEISSTGLQLINTHTFKSWTLVLNELIIRNNTNLKNFSPDMVETVLEELEILDLSSNPIQILDQNTSWFSYSFTKHLLLKQQPKLDLFLKTDLLKSLPRLTKIDFSVGIISDNNEDLIKRNFPNALPNLRSINVSYTNLTEHMLIDLLTILSNSANQTINAHLLGHTLNDENFCSYFTIFQKSPNLLRLQLDETHQCNCVVDLFYRDEDIQIVMKDSPTQPDCLFNSTRTRCDISAQLGTSKCSIAKPNPDDSGTNEGNIGRYSFIGIMVGIAAVVMLLLGLGSGMVYRVQKNRRMTVLDMDQPVENPLTAIIEERLQKTN